MTAIEPRFTCSISSSSCLRRARSSKSCRWSSCVSWSIVEGSNWSVLTRSKSPVNQRTTVSSRSRTVVDDPSTGRDADGTGSAGRVGVGAVIGLGVATEWGSSEERIQSSMARSSPPTHLRSTSEDSLGETAARLRRLRSGRRTVPTHFSTIWSESKAVGAPGGGVARRRGRSRAGMPASVSSASANFRIASGSVCPARTRASAASGVMPSASTSAMADGDRAGRPTVFEVSVAPSIAAGVLN